MGESPELLNPEEQATIEERIRWCDSAPPGHLRLEVSAGMILGGILGLVAVGVPVSFNSENASASALILMFIGGLVIGGVWAYRYVQSIWRDAHSRDRALLADWLNARNVRRLQGKARRWARVVEKRESYLDNQSVPAWLFAETGDGRVLSVQGRTPTLPTQCGMPCGEFELVIDSEQGSQLFFYPHSDEVKADVDINVDFWNDKITPAGTELKCGWDDLEDFIASAAKRADEELAATYKADVEAGAKQRSIFDWISLRRGRGQRMRAVVAAFEAKYPEEHRSRSWGREEVLGNGDVVISLTYGLTMPPRRSWWIVQADGHVCELSNRQVQGLIKSQPDMRR
ncbi:hypothetical protein KQI84_08100 [bacterium]|nr:hypothetical protein [bacterium]